MMKAVIALLLPICLAPSARAQSPAAAMPVTVQNFTRAEFDNYLATNVKKAGLGKLAHNREPASIDDQTVIRLNRDTLYSFGVFDLAAAPVTITLPDAGKRFMSLQIINEDHYVPFVAYDHKPHTLTEKNVGTRYVLVAIRTLVDPNDPKDLDEVHRLQDEIKVSQREAGKLELPIWDQTSLKEIRDALLVLAEDTPTASSMPSAPRSKSTRSCISSVPQQAGAAIRTRTRLISPRRCRRMTERPSTSSVSRMSR